MACYSICQFASVIILYTFYSNLTDMQFLYEDLFLISLFCVVFGRTESSKTLAKKPPPSSLIGLTPLISLALQTVSILSFQAVAVIMLQRQPWYRRHEPSNDDDYACHDNYAVFAVSVFQFITLAVVFSKGAPYRKPIYSNFSFTLSLLLMSIFTAYLVIAPHPWLIKMFEFEMADVKLEFRYAMVILAIINFVLAFATEAFIVDYLVFAKYKEWLRSRSTHNRQPYDKIYSETQNINWLPTPKSYQTISEINENSTQKNVASFESKNGFVRFSGDQH